MDKYIFNINLNAILLINCGDDLKNHQKFVNRLIWQQVYLFHMNAWNIINFLKGNKVLIPIITNLKIASYLSLGSYKTIRLCFINGSSYLDKINDTLSFKIKYLDCIGIQI